MSDSAVIQCPKCKTKIPITDAIAGPLLAVKEKEFEQKLVDLEAAAARNQEAMRATIREQERAQASSDVEEARQSAASAKLREAALADKLALAQQAQAQAVKRERELADKERELDLTIERRVNESSASLLVSAKAQVTESFKLQLAQQDQTARELREQIEDLKRKSEESSTRLQGEVQELALEGELRSRYPFDVIEEIAKGVNGADCSQLVRSASGADCGTILYESKRTKNWSPGWLPKLRTDLRAAKADIAVLVTQATPTDVTGFGNIDGVWVVQPPYVLGLAFALRETLLRVHAERQAQAGMATKAEEVYSYVIGPHFKHRVEAIVESFTTMREDLELEKRAVQRLWAKRESQIERVVVSTSGMFGDLQGIAGKSLAEPAGIRLLGVGA